MYFLEDFLLTVGMTVGYLLLWKTYLVLSKLADIVIH